MKRSFNEQHLGSAYTHALLIDSRDMRQIDVGVLSNLPIVSVRSHVDERKTPVDKKDPYLFSRDCVELTIDLGGNQQLYVFVNHLKSQFIDYRQASTPAKRKAARERNDKRRLAQAKRVRAILTERFPGQAFNQELFAVLGDLNEMPGSATLAPLIDDAGLERLLDRIPVESDRWTHWYRGENSVSQLDHVLLSPALSARTAGTLPVIERRGIGYARTLADRLPGPKRTSFVRSDDDPNPVAVIQPSNAPGTHVASTPVPGMASTPSAARRSIVAARGATPWAHRTCAHPSRSLQKMTGRSPPGPFMCGSTICSVNPAATAASKPGSTVSPLMLRRSVAGSG